MMENYLVLVLGMSKVGQAGDYHRFHIKNRGPTRVIELNHTPELPQGYWTFGVGLPHHIALATTNDKQSEELKHYIEGVGYTEIKDRNYFHSIYTHTPSGVLFEFTTSDIGSAIDEPVETLGLEWLLPPFFESRRAEIIAPLEPIKVPFI